MRYGGRQKPIEILTEEEVWALINACSRRAPSGRRDACLIALCAFAGLRTAEALALLPSQVHRQPDGTLLLVDLIGKGSRRRTAHVIPRSEQPILDWLEARKHLELPKRIQHDGRRFAPPLICSISKPKPGISLDTSNTRKMLKRRAATAGIEKRVHMHGLRHFHAYQLAQRGVKLHAVQQQLGHSRLETTSTYIAHLSAKDVGDEIQRAWREPA